MRCIDGANAAPNNRLRKGRLAMKRSGQESAPAGLRVNRNLPLVYGLSSSPS
jgi:hypothetical protein